MSTARPPLTRGATAPGALYTYRPNERPADRALQGIAEGAYAAGTHRRAYGSVDAAPPSSKPQSRYPTPPHTTSPPHSNASTPDSSDEDTHHPIASQGAGGMNSYFPPMSTPRSPVSSTPQVPIVAIRGSRSPTEDQRTHPDIQVSPTAYSMVAPIGSGFSPESITISAMKGNSLVIVADRWDMEKDCRHEWLWRFDRDADMSSVHANYDAGVLRVTVRRIPGYRLSEES